MQRNDKKPADLKPLSISEEASEAVKGGKFLSDIAKARHDTMKEISRNVR